MSYITAKQVIQRLFLLIALLFQSIFAAAQTAVTFPDPNLEELVRWALNKEPGAAILDTDIAELVALPQRSLQGDGIRALDGLEHAVNLTYLELPDNDIQDLRPMWDCPSFSIWISPETGDPAWTP